MVVTGVIFDLDGSLVDSMWMWKEIDKEFLSAHGITEYDQAALSAAIEGMSFTETAAYFKQRYALLESVEEIKAIWNDMAMEKYRNEVFLKPGAADFLKEMKQKKIRLGIATSNSTELVMAVLEARGIRAYFDTIVTSCEVKKGKPAPDVYLEAAKRMGCDPKHCLVMEDIPAGILAGKRAGMYVFAIEDAFSADLEAQKRSLADEWLSDYTELAERFFEDGDFVK